MRAIIGTVFGVAIVVAMIAISAVISGLFGVGWGGIIASVFGWPAMPFAYWGGAACALLGAIARAVHIAHHVGQVKP